MNTTENNKLIADFMGCKTNKTALPTIVKSLDVNEIWLPFQGIVNINKLKYNTDWNWLMKVVEKIESLDIYYDEYIDYNSSMVSSGKIELSTKIEAVYEQVVNFIKWYNEQKSA